MKDQIYNNRLSIVKSWANISERSTLKGSVYYEGSYYCEWGIVEAVSETDNHVSHFRFIYKGILYTRTISRSYSKRGLSVMAGKFVKGIVAKYTRK